MTASYLQPTKTIKATEYVNSAFNDVSPHAASSSEASVVLSDYKEFDSRFTTPENPGVSEILSAPSGLGIEVPSKPEFAPSPLERRNEQSLEIGRRLIPQIMDDLAVAEPQRTVFSLASLSDGHAKLNPISAEKFTQSVDKTAWWLSDLVGTPGSVQPIAYIGPRRSLNPN
jgi:hypothetical protein